MNSRYGLWILPVCLISLAGCANWQNRSGLTTQPGNAAGLNLNAAPFSEGNGPLLGAADANFGGPPPPVAPPPSSDFGMSLPPSSAPQDKLDLASVSDSPSPARPAKLYNLESSSKPGRSSGNGSGSSEKSSKSSTISKLAEKSKSETAAKTVAKAEAPAPVRKRESSALERLARESATSSEETKQETKPVTAEVQAPLPRPESVVEPAPAEQSAPAEDTTALDTMMLAQPVRKGAAANESGSQDSKGPQSRVIPAKKLFKDNIKPVIYPVSNPATEEPVDITQFS